MEKTENTCIRGCANVDMINRGINQLAMLLPQFNDMSKLFNLLGNDTRLKILYLIKNEKDICVCDLSDILNLSVSAISQQLSKLKNGGILESKKQGQTIFYSISKNFDPILNQYLKVDLNLIK